MVLISEWLPNPAGADVTGEWVEFWNSGGEKVNISGWTLMTKNGNTAVLPSRELSPGEYAVIHRRESKFTLRNIDESLALYNRRRELVDSSGFRGTAPEGKSFARAGSGEDAQFAFADPTPGVPNAVAVPAIAAIAGQIPAESLLPSPMSGVAVAGLTFGSALLITLGVVIAIKGHENISKLFFGGN